jgi:preprotein translocase subunit SecF
MGMASTLYRGKNDFDFNKLWRITSVVSIVIVVISVGSFFLRGLNLSIDFEGGSIWEVPAKSFTEAEANAVLTKFGDAEGEKFQEATLPNGDQVLRISGRVNDVDEGTKVANALAEAANLDTGEVKVNTVGPSWGDDITRQARNSLIVFLILVALYIAWRLETKMAIAAIVAVVHDVILTVGVYSIFQIEVTPATVISFLTILGFSLYDTVVVYDRVQENATRLGRSGQYTYAAMMRRSLNQVFMRSVNTTITTILPIISMLVVGQFVFGQQTLGDFSLALLIGLISGTYSSLFVAAPLTVWLKEREPRYADIRRRLSSRGVDVSDTSWHGLAAPRLAAAGGSVPPRPSRSGGAGASGETDSGGATSPSSGTATAAPPRPSGASPYGNHPPRPRKKKKR